MAITVNLPNALIKLADGQRTLTADGGTVGQVVDRLSEQFPNLGPRLRDEHGQPYQFVTFYLNDEDIRLSGGFDAPLSDGDELTVVPAVAGG